MSDIGTTADPIYTDDLGRTWQILPDGTMVSADDPTKVIASDLTPTWTVALETLSPTITQKIASQQQRDEPWWETWARIASSVIMADQQRQLMQINVERAKRGEPPLDVAAYSSVGVQVGVSQNTQQFLTYAGIAVLGFLLINTLARR
jgi:hypothetical protein